MSSSLFKMIQKKKHVKRYGRVTNKNKQKIINYLNRNSRFYDLNKVNKKSSISEITKVKNDLLDKLEYDILSESINTGHSLIAEMEGKEVTKNKNNFNEDTLHLAKYAGDLSKAKRESDKNLTDKDKKTLNEGNFNIEGYGNRDVVTEFEKKKNESEINNLIEEIKNQDVNELAYDNKIEIFKRTFQKVGITRENDLNKLEEKLRGMSFDNLLTQVNLLLQSLELYSSDQLVLNETDLANGRLDDALIRLGIKKTGKRKVSKVLNKYKKQ